MMEHGKGRCVLRCLCSVSVVQCIMCMVLLMLGILSRSNHGPYHHGVPPYYTGSFITMATVLLQSFLGFLIFYRGKDCANKNEVAKKVGFWMQAYSLCIFLFGIGQIASLLVVGFAGICTSSYCSYLDNEKQNRDFAITILVFTFLAIVSSAIGFILLNMFSSYHGFKMFSRGQYQVTPLHDHEVTNIEQTPVSVISTGHVGDNQNLNHYHQTLSNYAHHSHPDPRLETPTADYSAHHVSHYLTQQFRERIRKRKKKTKKTNKGNPKNNGKRNGRQNRSAPYELPPLSTLSQLYPHHVSPPRDSPSPPSASVIFPPPSPPSPPQPVTPSSVPLPEIRTTQPSPPPWSLTPSPPPPPPSPPMDYLKVVHVIPYGEDMDDDSSLYSCN